MPVDLLLFVMADALLEKQAREAERDVLYLPSDKYAPMGTHRLGAWRMTWWR